MFEFTVDFSNWQLIGLILDYAIKIIAIGFVPEGRRPSSSTAWLLAILLLPYVGLPLFLLMGSPYINRRRHAVQQEANKAITDVHEDMPDYPSGVLTSHEVKSIVRLNRKLTHMPAVNAYNHGLHTNYNQTIKDMAQAIDRAEDYVHAEIYIMAWDDTTDCFFRALERAVGRGVHVRLLFDHVGSWRYPGYLKLGRRLDSIGVHWELMLPLQPWRWRFRRPDLRNHRKMLIIDGKTGFMGSMNMIDSSYLRRKNRRVGRYWEDCMVELSGPIIASMNMVFAVDWYLETEELIPISDHSEFLTADHTQDNINVVQLVPSGPGYQTQPNLRMFNQLIHHSKQRLVMCSPYFIPDESMLEAVTSAAYRGVNVELYVSERGDQFMVHHAQSSYYQALLEAGVKIYLYKTPAVLHTKFMLADPNSADDSLGVIGSSNMDMRSFDLNFEVSLLATNGNIVSQLADLTEQYRASSRELTLEEWNQRSWGRRYVDNVMRLTSALQ